MSAAKILASPKMGSGLGEATERRLVCGDRAEQMVLMIPHVIMLLHIGAQDSAHLTSIQIQSDIGLAFFATMLRSENHIFAELVSRS